MVLDADPRKVPGLFRRLEVLSIRQPRLEMAKLCPQSFHPEVLLRRPHRPAG